MNKTPIEAAALAQELVPLVAKASAEVVICPPFVCLEAVGKVIGGTDIALGSQNVHWAESGAYTGEISAQMLKELGVKYVIIGHSERRQYFGETDDTVNKRSLAAINAGLLPIICVGETLSEREQGITAEVVKRQTEAALKGFAPEQVSASVIAYEPVWAIGTGRTATAEDANEVIGVIRATVRTLFGAAAEAMRIQYGGSMNPKNAAELMAMPEIDGGLIGGASLKAADFAAVVNY